MCRASSLRWLLPCLVLTAADVSAQEAASLSRGTRLRVTAPTLAPTPIVGTLLRVTEHEIVLGGDASNPTVIPRSGVSRVERSVGRRGHGQKGLIVGSGVGAAVLSAINAQDPETGGAQEYLGVALVGAGVGALAGAGVGALIRTERWTDLPAGSLRVTARASPRLGVSFGLAWTW